jgi:peptidoglycan/xylan/chitin deacetylase (PgdA/CDA1 family)
MSVFKDQINIIKILIINFIIPENLEKNFNKEKNEKKILITIDDGFSSFYENAWPYLKENKIPFILFVSTEAVGKNGYMSWDQIKEVEKVPTAFIGNHSHSHDYLGEF